MTFDLVITTFNRPEQVIRLAREVRSCLPVPNLVIIVDSSDLPNEYVKNIPGISYLRSSHKNQPYQRLLGARASLSDVVIFLDDDLEIIKGDIFLAIVAPFTLESIIGSSVGFAYSDGHSGSKELNLPGGSSTSLPGRLFWQFTGVPEPWPKKRVGSAQTDPTRPAYAGPLSEAIMVS